MVPNAIRAIPSVRAAPLNRAIEDEPSASMPIPPHIAQALLRLRDTRRQRTARLLSLADRERHRAFAQLRHAEIELASLSARTDAIQRESILAVQNRQALARDLLALHAAQARNAALLATTAEHVSACATRWEIAQQRHARLGQQYRTANRKHECLRIGLERFEEAGQE